jgi:hypothetical protein
LQDGRLLRATFYGSYGTTATPTLKLQLRWGGVAGTIIAASAANTTTSGTGGGASMTAMWSAEVFIQVRSNGSSGTLMSNGQGLLYTSTALTAGTVTNYGQPFPIASGSTGGTTPVVATVDLTSDTALAFTATWSAAAAANSIQGLNYVLEALN